MTPLIEAKGLAIGHPGRLLAREISFAVKAGDVLALLGPNGAGKTTLFRTLLGLAPSFNGEVYLGGENIAKLSRARIACAAALVPQSMSAPFAFTALDVVLMARTARLRPFARPGMTDHKAARSALGRVGMAHLALQPVTTMSGGQRQLVLIARALAQDAPLLILDEPTASLDWGNRIRLTAHIRDLAGDGFGLILSTHDPDHAARIATRVLTLDRDGGIWQGTPAEAVEHDRLARLYGLSAEILDAGQHKQPLRA